MINIFHSDSSSLINIDQCTCRAHQTVNRRSNYLINMDCFYDVFIKCLVKKILICVSKMNKSLMGLKQHEVKQLLTKFSGETTI